jgi:hypothetical protein
MNAERREQLTGDVHLKALLERIRELEEAVAPFVHGVIQVPDGFDWERGHIRADVLAWEWKRLQAVLAKPRPEDGGEKKA